MTRAEFLSHREHWITKIQLDLYNELRMFMETHNINRTQLAERLGVSKGYVSQVLNGDFDHKISKLVDLSLMMNKVPEISYPNLMDIIVKDMNEDEPESPLTESDSQNTWLRNGDNLRSYTKRQSGTLNEIC
ncbi:MAG: helix-turn-helix transcriptional regulator [Rudanella sp.]|nr:helix-turn-helix transcriptional regulator [Rudanella sp.]